ncbi:MAG: lipid droplet-associated protein [Pseudonocardiaceae bacterium]
MSPLPLPVRVAVGLLVTAVEQARKLPEQLSELPVTAASRAVQTAMRVQQRVTELAIKGDQVCALLRPIADTPPWARFDEDNEPGVPDAKTPDATTEDTRIVASEVTTPPVLPDYDELSLAQLRDKLRELSLPQLAELLEYEHAHQDRAAFVTLLSNRISTVRADAP